MTQLPELLREFRRAVIDADHCYGEGNESEALSTEASTESAILDRFASLKERSDSYRSRLKDLAGLCGMASSKLCSPVSEKDIQSAKSCVETGIYVMRDLLAEEKSLSDTGEK